MKTIRSRILWCEQLLLFNQSLCGDTVGRFFLRGTQLNVKDIKHIFFRSFYLSWNSTFYLFIYFLKDDKTPEIEGRKQWGLISCFPSIKERLLGHCGHSHLDSAPTYTSTRWPHWHDTWENLIIALVPPTFQTVIGAQLIQSPGRSDQSCGSGVTAAAETPSNFGSLIKQLPTQSWNFLLNSTSIFNRC